jgi:DNA-binding MarR family transcriptional regulator
MNSDAVDRIIEQWTRERPDLVGDLDAMGLFGRASRWMASVIQTFDRFAEQRGMTQGEVDLVFTLRRSGAPYTLTPSALARSMMLSPAGITNRIDKLEQRGIVERALDPEDRRSFRVSLTDDGLRLADELVVAHLANEQRMLAALSANERKQLDKLLRKLLAASSGSS